MNLFNFLPNDVHNEIFSHLQIKDIYRVGLTNTINNKNTIAIIRNFINKYITKFANIKLQDPPEANTIVFVTHKYNDCYIDFYNESGVTINYGKQHLFTLFKLWRLTPIILGSKV